MNEKIIDGIEKEHIVQRTIEEVIDTDSGEVITADDFFAQSEKIIIDARNVADLGYKTDMPKFRCLYCEQGIKISGRKIDKHSSVSYFFAHYKDSDDCPIKTSLGKNLNEILAEKYQGINEGEDHRRLKTFIANALELENAKAKGVSNVKVEATFQNKEIMANWRRPDISASFVNKSLVFELQLSTTFLSVVNDRDNFYRQHNTFIIWVFGSFILNKDWQKLMAKDIYYANKRNVFVIDKDAQKATEERKELILKCYWQIPKVINAKVEIDWHSKLISLDELTYDEEQFKVFYYDSDKDFYEAADPKEREMILEWEKAKEERWRKLIENINKRVVSDVEREKIIERQKHKQEEKQKQREIILQKFENDEISLTPECIDGKWGFVSNSQLLSSISPKYSEVMNFKNGWAWVKQSNWGAINIFGEKILNFDYNDVYFQGDFHRIRHKKTNLFSILNKNGKEIIPCEYTEIQYLENGVFKVRNYYYGIFDSNCNKIIPCEYGVIEVLENKTYKVKKGNFWGIIDQNGDTLIEKIEVLNEVRFKALKFGRWALIDEYKNEITSFDYEIINLSENENFIVMKNNYWGIIDKNGNEILQCQYQNIEALENGSFKVRKNYFYGILDFNYKEILSFQYNDIEVYKSVYKLKKEGFYGILDFDCKEILPFQYNDIEVYENVYKVKKGEFWGVIDQNGNEIFQCQYQDIAALESGSFKVRKNYFYGILDANFNEIIPCEYDFIELLENKTYKVKKGNFWGIIDQNGDTLIEKIEVLNEVRFKALKFGRWALIDEYKNEITSFDYEIINLSENENFIVMKNNYWGIIDKNGNEILQCQCQNIEALENGSFKVRKNYSWGILDFNYKELLSFQYNDIEVYESVYKVKKEGFYGILDFNCKEILPFQYNDIEVYESVYKVKKEGFYGILDFNCKEILPFQYNDIEVYENSIYKVRIHDLYGVIDINGRVNIPCLFSNITILENGNYFVQKIVKNNFLTTPNYILQKILEKRESIPKICGVFNAEGTEIVPCEFQNIEILANGNYKVKKNEGWGIFNVLGNQIIPCNFFKVDLISSNHYKVLKVVEKNKDNNRKSYNKFYYGIIDNEGKEIIPCLYSEISLIENNNLYKVKKGIGISVFDTNGQEYLPSIFKDDEQLNSFLEGSLNLENIIISDEGFLMPDILKKNIIIKNELQSLIKDYPIKGIVNKKDGNTIFVTLSHDLFGTLDLRENLRNSLNINDNNLFEKGSQIIVYINEILPYKVTLSLSAHDKNTKKHENIIQVQEGHRYEGIITGIKDYGLFITIKKNIFGLLHINQLTNLGIDRKNIYDAFSIGQKLEVNISSIDAKSKKISFNL